MGSPEDVKSTGGLLVVEITLIDVDVLKLDVDCRYTPLEIKNVFFFLQVLFKHSSFKK